MSLKIYLIWINRDYRYPCYR